MRGGHAQSGCLSFGSLLIAQQCQSAICHRQVVACPAAGNAVMCFAISPHAINKWAVRPSAASAPAASFPGCGASGKLSGNTAGSAHTKAEQIDSAPQHRLGGKYKARLVAARVSRIGQQPNSAFQGTPTPPHRFGNAKRGAPELRR